MKNIEIIEALDRWNFWNRKINTGVWREFYLKKLRPLFEMPEIVAATGARRAGKSTIVLQMIKDLIKEGINPANTCYVNFEEPKLDQYLSAKGLTQIYESYLEFFNPKGKVYLFLDEVQLAKNWERFAVSLYDRKENVKIMVTGSSSKLLKSEVSTLLSGRYISQIIYPLSFAEFLQFSNVSYKGIKRPEILYYLRQYVEYGGFPRVVLEKDKTNKKRILVEYFNSILERDIILRYNIKNVRDVKELAIFVLTNISSQISTYRIEKTLGISNQNARRYFEYFSSSFLLQFVNLFSFSVKKQIYNPQKVFCVDSGLRNAVSFKFSEDIGKLLENVVFNKLQEEGKEVFFWKNKTEIDFIARKGYKVAKLYNVCFSLEEKETWEREKASLIKGMSEFKQAKAELIYWKGKPRKGKLPFSSTHILDFLLG